MIYAAIDTETTGLGEKCALLELAIVLEDTAARPLPRVEDLPCFTTLVDVAGGAWWELYPIGMHQKNGLLEALATAAPRAPSFDEADDMAATWLSLRVGDKPRAVTPAGKNFAGFDKRFLGPRLSRLLHHRAIDPGSVFVNFDKGVPGMDQLVAGGYGERPAGVVHRALEDARDVVRVLRTRYA